MTLTLRAAATLALTLAVIVLGGASAAGFGANAALQFAGAGLIAWTLWDQPPSAGTPTGLRRFLLALGLVAVIQLLPLPAALWQLLPGRGAIAAGYDLAGMARPWLPLSLDPWGTVQSLVWWLPALGLLAAARSRGAVATRHLVWLIAALAYVAVLLAGIQSLVDTGYFYTVTNRGNGVGFFANSNHLATFLLAAMPLLAGQWLYDQPLARRGSPGRIERYALPLLLAPLAIGVVLSNSLAGMLLLVPIALGIMVMARPATRINWWLAGFIAVLGSLGLVWLLASGLVSNDLMARSGTAGISRSEFLANGLEMLGQFAPFGSGLGTFRELYPWFEDAAQVGTTYVNHAHNDLLELLIETGLFGLVLLGLFLRWFTAQAWRIWNGPRDENTLAQAATLSIMAILGHSLVDYPLRTAAVSSVAALCCVVMRRAPEARGAAVKAQSAIGAGKREVMLEI